MYNNKISACWHVIHRAAYLFALLHAIALRYPVSCSSIDVTGNTNRVLAFGDDYSDTGNLRRLASDSRIGYDDGRFTNGPLFVEYMATLLDRKLSSYAYAQSTINSTLASSTYHSSIQIPSLDGQVVDFAEKERDWIRRKPGVRGSIAVVTAGMTDVLKQQPPFDTLTVELSKQIVQGVFEQLHALSKLGFESILVGNLPALHVLPLWRSSAYVDLLRDFVKSTNRLFSESLLGFEQSASTARLWMLDLESFLLVAANATFAKSIGAKNTTHSCISNRGACADPADYVFYDQVHPDMRLHHLLGLAAANLVNGQQVQYTDKYFAQLASEYDIGVLHHETGMAAADSRMLTATIPAPATVTADDPLVTGATSSAASCSLPIMCTTVGASAIHSAASLRKSSASGGVNLPGPLLKAVCMAITSMLIVGHV
ncbi:hypothetical protein GQ54DRAFT_201671 [Martensiomyces pterosporus]|nr:hypothetical protein GQ54DRAFT_201671 [Martensiomyces pterosporus]